VLKRVVAGAAVAFVALVLAGPAFVGSPAHLAVTGSPADYGLRYEAIDFLPADRVIHLRGWWMPAADARAAVVMVHGGGDDNRTQPYQNGLALMRDLVGRGFAVLAFDLRNFGESDATPEGRTFGDLEGNDVLGAVGAALGRLPGKPVAALGCSMGGASVIQAAARGAPLAAIVTDSAFADAREVAVPFTVAAVGWPRLLVVPFVWSAEWVHRVPLGRGSTLDAARRVPSTTRALVIQNDGDPIVPVAHARELAAAMPSAETWITPAPPADHPLVGQQGPFGMHCQSYKLDPEGYVARVTAFVDVAIARR
jgi:alpha-beta hydrolase superfamily lysophospholipase